jgi:hypothetical protein
MMHHRKTMLSRNLSCALSSRRHTKTYVLGNDDGKESTSVTKQICDHITRVSAEAYYTFRSVCQSVAYCFKHSGYATNSMVYRQRSQIMYQGLYSHNTLRRCFCYKSHRALHSSIINEVQIRIYRSWSWPILLHYPVSGLEKIIKKGY